MRRLVKLAAVGLLAAGCATNSSVKQQIDPLAERLSKVEASQAAANDKLGAIDTKIDTKMDAQAADTQALRGEIADSKGQAQQAQQSAADAKAAADRAQAAADEASASAAKSTKAFELRQKKPK